LSSEFVASMPARILYRSFHSVVCWMAYISSLRRSSAVISRRKSPEVSRGEHPFARWLGGSQGDAPKKPRNGISPIPFPSFHASCAGGFVLDTGLSG
jgi:hypothetical protein